MALEVLHLGQLEYHAALQRMRTFTDCRDETTADQIWQVEHPPVFTLGQAGKREHLLLPGDIPVVQSDRGGQVTYHGPGQLVLYVLIDLKRGHIGVRQLVSAIEDALIALLKEFGIQAIARPEAPGVYVVDSHGEPGAKIGALGLRVRRGRSYHGLSLNCCMDLEPFSRINPCGLIDQAITQLTDLVGEPVQPAQVSDRLVELLASELGLQR